MKTKASWAPTQTFRSALEPPAAGVHDTLVNQLLTKIDGVDSLNNILLIGMTNRKDMLDEALLRPGRLEVQVEIGLPDEQGRLQILKVGASHARWFRRSRGRHRTYADSLSGACAFCKPPSDGGATVVHGGAVLTSCPHI